MINRTDSILYQTDGYKPSHWKQYPPGTEYVHSYFESRGGPFAETVHFGLQYIIEKHLENPRLSPGEIMNAYKFYNEYYGSDIFHYHGWMHVFQEHRGQLPLKINSVPEGSIWKPHTALFTIENTCPECFWLPGWVETALVRTWYPSIVATQSREAKKTIKSYLDETGDPSLLSFKLHDFGFRGVSSAESAGIGGAAHLVNFSGTDTIAGIIVAQDYYRSNKMLGNSVPAAEHSTITSWGKEHEVDAFRNMLEQFPEGIVAVVSDSYDIYHAVSQYWGKELKDQVLNRNGTVVVRPDSGDPAVVVCRVIQGLMDAFGYTTNEKGFKVLPPQIRVIQGDGINLRSINSILFEMKYHGFSADNITFGMGGALLQKVDRDIMNYALKCSLIVINGEEVPVSKAPIGSAMKASRSGRQNHEGMETLFEDGHRLKIYKFDEVRENAKL